VAVAVVISRSAVHAGLLGEGAACLCVRIGSQAEEQFDDLVRKVEQRK